MNNQQYLALKNKSDIFVALDFPDKAAANHLLQRIDSNQCHLKIGLEMFTRFGPEWVDHLSSNGFNIFLDLKCYDIPQTVAKTMRSIASMGVSMTTLHASGGQEMMEAARDSINHLPASERPLLIAVTMLTSFSVEQVQQIWGQDIDLEDVVINMAQLAQASGMDGVVCSPHEAALIRQACGNDFAIITPGIRLESADDDQKRVASPNDARNNGSDFLVIGRPITQANNPQAILSSCLKK